MNFAINEISRLPINRFRLEEVLYNIVYDDFAYTFEEAHSQIKRMLIKIVDIFTDKMTNSDTSQLNY